MKKFLFLLSSTLLLSGTVFAQSYNLMQNNISWWDGNTSNNGFDITFTEEYKGGGWVFDEGYDFAGKTTVTVKYSLNRSERQISLNVAYVDPLAESGEYFVSTDPSCQVLGAGGQAILTLNQSYQKIARIYVQAGWGETMPPSTENPIVLTMKSAKIDDPNYVPVAPASPLGLPIDFENFGIEYTFFSGTPYFPLHEWGWPGDEVVSVENDPAGINGKSLKYVIANWDFTALFKEISLGEKTAEDIASISFDVYFEKKGFFLPNQDIPEYDLDNDDDVMNTPILIYLGDPAHTLGNGNGFINAKSLYFNGIPADQESQVGIVGNWFTNTVTYDDLVGSGNAGTTSLAPISDKSIITFGIGFKAGPGDVYYVDNITLVDWDGNIITRVENVVAPASAKVYSIPGGLAIPGGEKAVIYGIDGSIVASTSAAPEIMLPKGVYIVKIGNEAVKAIVK